jgi:hypothetical protein
MTHRGVGHPDGARCVVDAEPHSPASSDLVLPLLKRCPVHDSRAKAAFKAMLAVVVAPRICGELLPRHSRVCGRRRADLVPTLGGVASSKPKVPAIGTRWGCDSLFPFRHGRLRGRGRDRFAGRVDGFCEAPGKLRVGVNFGGGSPLSDVLGDRCEVAEVDRRKERYGEVGGERGLVAFGKEHDPRKGIAQRIGEDVRVVHREVAKDPSEYNEGFYSIVVTVGLTEPQGRRIASTQEDIMGDDLGHDFLRLAQKLGELAIDCLHASEYI